MIRQRIWHVLHSSGDFRGSTDRYPLKSSSAAAPAEHPAALRGRHRHCHCVQLTGRETEAPARGGVPESIDSKPPGPHRVCPRPAPSSEGTPRHAPTSAASSLLPALRPHPAELTLSWAQASPSGSHLHSSGALPAPPFNLLLTPRSPSLGTPRACFFCQIRYLQQTPPPVSAAHVYQEQGKHDTSLLSPNQACSPLPLELGTLCLLSGAHPTWHHLPQCPLCPQHGHGAVRTLVP